MEQKCVCVYEEGKEECVCVCCKCVYPEGEENCVCVPCESEQGQEEETEEWDTQP